jgi:hypothetical protein
MGTGFREHVSGCLYLEGKGWQIAAQAVPVESEDIPDAAMAALAGICMCVQLNLEPGSAPSVAYGKLRKVAKLLSQQTTGVIEDAQEGSYQLATGVARYVKPEREKDQRFSILKMSWWFERDLAGTRERLDEFIGLLGRSLPEALPRRYGLFEPPQFTFSETGKIHFVDLLAAHRSGVICYPTRPVWGIHFGLNPKSGFVNIGGKRQYKSSYFQIAVDSAVLDQENWRRQLYGTWKDLSRALQPFYGDVRVLDNFIARKTTYFSDVTTQSHPVKGWWWRGVPSNPAKALVIGDPYVDLWPEVRAVGARADGLYFISTRDWMGRETIESILKVPGAIAQWVDPEARRPTRVEDIRATLERIKKEGRSSIVLPEQFPFAEDRQESKPETPG